MCFLDGKTYGIVFVNDIFELSNFIPGTSTVPGDKSGHKEKEKEKKEGGRKSDSLRVRARSV